MLMFLFLKYILISLFELQVSFLNNWIYWNVILLETEYKSFTPDFVTHIKQQAIQNTHF